MSKYMVKMNNAIYDLTAYRFESNPSSFLVVAYDRAFNINGKPCNGDELMNLDVKAERIHLSRIEVGLTLSDGKPTIDDQTKWFGRENDGSKLEMSEIVRRLTEEEKTSNYTDRVVHSLKEHMVFQMLNVMYGVIRPAPINGSENKFKSRLIEYKLRPLEII
jgi:hypothetical protein